VLQLICCDPSHLERVFDPKKMFPPIEPKANLALNSCLQAPRISLAQSRVSRQIYQPSCGVFADVKEDSASIVGRNLLYRILMAAFSRLMITARRWLSSLSYSPINRNWSNRPRNFNIELADESPHPELRRSYLGNQNNATVQRVQASAENHTWVHPRAWNETCKVRRACPHALRVFAGRTLGRPYPVGYSTLECPIVAP
jgi:hypothetical protein